MLLSAHSLQCADSCKYLVSDGGDEGSRNETLAAMYKETVILQRRPAELNCVSVGQPQPDFFTCERLCGELMQRCKTARGEILLAFGLKFHVSSRCN